MADAVINLHELKATRIEAVDRVEPQENSRKKYLWPVIWLLIIVVPIAASLIYIKYFYNKATGSFYIGKWSVLLSDADKQSKGLESLDYEFTNDFVTEQIVSTAQNIHSTAKVSAKYHIEESGTDSIVFKQEDFKVDSYVVNIPDSFCLQTGINCDSLKEQLRTTFDQKLSEQNKADKDKVYKVTRISEKRIEFDTGIVLDRV